MMPCRARIYMMTILMAGSFGFLGRETSTDNGDHNMGVIGCWEVLSRNVLLPLPMNAFLCTGMLIMK